MRERHALLFHREDVRHELDEVHGQIVGEDEDDVWTAGRCRMTGQYRGRRRGRRSGLGCVLGGAIGDGISEAKGLELSGICGRSAQFSRRATMRVRSASALLASPVTQSPISRRVAGRPVGSTA